MRHGQSLANHKGLIASHPGNALENYGLVAAGRDQVAESLGKVAVLGTDTRILSSDYRRARETAEIAHRLLVCDEATEFDHRLRERDFGDFELTADDNYQQIWRQDEAGVEGGWRGVEGPGQVMARITSLIVDCESHSRGETFLLVSHGDVLQILQTAFAREQAARHRRQPHLHPAEIRELRLQPKPV